MPKSIIFMAVVFGWGAGQVLDSIVRYSIKIDYFVWESIGVPFLHFLFSFTSLALTVSALTVLLKPRPAGYMICLIAASWSAIYGALVTWLALRDLPGVREIYLSGREIRGLSVREEAADLIFTPTGMLGSYGLALLFWSVVIFLLWRRRDWFLTAA